MRLFALRGATTVKRNDSADILAATEELLHEMMDRNELDPADLVSVIFTTTADLNAEFPALAGRWLGVPLLCAAEIDVPGAMRSVVRVLMHYQTDDGHTPRHVYLGDARKLRLDLDGPQ
jgi:chorismate mutase